MGVEAFGIEKEFLRDLLQEAESGRSQLPEFQRGWVWPMEGIRSLLASISLGYPVGTIMMLRTGGEVRFKHRPIQGATPTRAAQRLILDGQQRITSLYQALKLGRPLQTQDAHRRSLSGWFYVDMDKALDPHLDREEAFTFVPADRLGRDFRGQVSLDLSTHEQEFARGMFPLNQTLDPDEWLDGYVEHWDYDRERQKQKQRFSREFLRLFDRYQVPVIELLADTPRQAVCQVFEKVNTGGVTLTVFELLTATYAADEFDLRQDWDSRSAKWAAPEYKVLREVSNTDFLQVVTLLSTFHARSRFLQADADEDRAPRVGCRRSDILNLPLADYQRLAPDAVGGFLAAAKLMHQLHVFDTKFLPYGSQLIPLAAAFAVLGAAATGAQAIQRITRWVWCGVLGELYGGTTETRFARDLPELVAWARGSTEIPRTIEDANFSPGRLDTLRTRGSAAYKGIYALLMLEDALDWRSGQSMQVATYFDDHVDIHHIFPRAWCERQGIEATIYNSIINKTPLTARTNRIMSGHAPSDYLGRLANSAGVERSAILSNVATHLVAADLLEADKFEEFVQQRRESLLAVIAAAMGKPVYASLLDTFDGPVDSDDDLEDE